MNVTAHESLRQAEHWIASLASTEAAWRRMHCDGKRVCVGSHATISSLVDCVRCAPTGDDEVVAIAQGNATLPAKNALRRGLRLARAAVRADGAPSLWLEFGAWSGASTRIIRDAAFAVNKSDGVHSFDSFEGLPEDWRPDPRNRTWAVKQFLSKGSFSRRGRPPFHEPGIHWQVLREYRS